jgi:ankyrin repeat protein
MPQPTQPNNDDDGQPKPFDGFLCLNSTAEIEEFLAQHIFSSFMWAVSKEIPKQKLGASEVDTHAAERFNFMDHDWDVVKLVNKTIQDVARDIEATGLGTIEEIYLVLIPPLSVASKLPNEAIVEMIRRKAKDFEQRHQWREAASAYTKLLELYEECEARDQFTYKGIAAVIDFLVTTTSIPTPDDYDTNSDDEEISSDEAKDLLCEKLTKGSLGPVSAQIRELYVNQCREEAYDKAMGWPWEATNSDAQLSEAADVLLFGYTQLHKEIVGDKEGEMDFDCMKTGENWYSSDILGWTPFHYGVHRYMDNFQIKTEEVNIERVSKMRDSANRTLLDHALMRGVGTDMVNTFLSIYSASSLESGRDGLLSLHWAAMSGYGKTMVFLLKHATLRKDQKERLAIQGDFWGRTALHLAANQGHLDTVKDLMEWAEQASLGKSLATEADNKGRTALHLAAFIGHDDVVGELLASQPWERIIIPDDFGYTALHIAVERLHDKVVETIVDSLGKDSKGGKEEYTIGKQQYWKVLDLETHEKESSYYYEKETVLDIARRLEDKVEQDMDQLEQDASKKTEAQDTATNEGETAHGTPQDDVTANDESEGSESANNQADKKEELQNQMESIKNIFSSLFQGEKEDSEESARKLLWAVKVESKTGFDVLVSKGVKDFVQDKDDKKTILHIEAERGYIDRYVYFLVTSFSTSDIWPVLCLAGLKRILLTLYCFCLRFLKF